VARRVTGPGAERGGTSGGRPRSISVSDTGRSAVGPAAGHWLHPGPRAALTVQTATPAMARCRACVSNQRRPFPRVRWNPELHERSRAPNPGGRLSVVRRAGAFTDIRTATPDERSRATRAADTRRPIPSRKLALLQRNKPTGGGRRRLTATGLRVSIEYRAPNFACTRSPGIR